MIRLLAAQLQNETIENVLHLDTPDRLTLALWAHVLPCHLCRLPLRERRCWPRRKQERAGKESSSAGGQGPGGWLGRAQAAGALYAGNKLNSVLVKLATARPLLIDEEAAQLVNDEEIKTRALKKLKDAAL